MSNARILPRVFMGEHGLRNLLKPVCGTLPALEHAAGIVDSHRLASGVPERAATSSGTLKDAHRFLHTCTVHGGLIYTCVSAVEGGNDQMRVT